jgi:ribosomal protein S18 acetylase RimI-like enzyme
VTTITALLARLDACYDAIPRVAGARAEEWGPFVLFVREPPGWPYYARPRPGVSTATAAEVEAVRARQRELGMPEAFEWVHELAPGLLPVVAETGLTVLEAPLMVLDPERLPAPALARTERAEVVVLDPDGAGFADAHAASAAVARIGFGAHVGSNAGPVERDAATTPSDPAVIELAGAVIRSGRGAEAVLATPGEGIVARGGLQRARGAAEIVGVATLPSARRRGYGAAVSAALARHALDRGDDLVFLSAASEDVARVYGRIGFRRVGTACISGPPPL